MAEEVDVTRETSREDTATDPSPSFEALLLSGGQSARSCGVCKRTWQKLDARALVPRPIRIGRRKLWALSDLREWTASGCPPRDVFEARRRSQ